LFTEVFDELLGIHPLPRPQPLERQPQDLQRYCGVFEKLSQRVTVSINDSRLVATIDGTRYPAPTVRYDLTAFAADHKAPGTTDFNAAGVKIDRCLNETGVEPGVITAALEKLDQSLLEAAADLGCPRWRTFWAVTLPLSAPGVVAGSLLCFIPIVGEFVIPDLLGGSQTAMIGQAIWSEFFANKDWPTAAAVAVVLVCLLVTPIVAFQHQTTRGMEGG